MLKELIDKFYLDKERDREQHHFYITDAGKCSRAIFFKFKNMPRKKMTPEILRMFDHGNYVQMQILNALFGLGIVRASEINIPPQQLISGRADAILTLDNELYVVDFKSMNSMIFQKLEAAKEENINQIQLYMHFFEIPKGILLYVNKNTLELKEFALNYNPALCENLLQDLAALKIKIEKNIVPLRLSGYPENWQCRYCQFKEICKITGQKEVSWEAFKKKVQEGEGLDFLNNNI
ncbi:PD-(D/E)XK nuclease family protein [Patescibacteria group bacterium]|nr:PD-(D/E)XK nuclease family protein [Patescibacteria group bacterium]MBU4481446.1 PD-(D/E)XK nuclease family protein [Patescibacteria group bacterium]